MDIQMLWFYNPLLLIFKLMDNPSSNTQQSDSLRAEETVFQQETTVGKEIPVEEKTETEGNDE